MLDSGQPRITKSGLRKGGAPLGNVNGQTLPSVLPELAGKQFGKLTVVSGEIFRRGKPAKAYLLVECQCGLVSAKYYTNVIKSKAGCRRCGHPKRVPLWLYHRAQGAQLRCTDSKNQEFPNYGGRGIEFRFTNPLEMALWVQENLGLEKHLEFDRIDNNGHYEPGNLQYATRRQNQNNTRLRRRTPEMHSFRLAHPEIRYSDASLKVLFWQGLTWKQIVDRHSRCKSARLGSGISSTPDPVIASLWKDS